MSAPQCRCFHNLDSHNPISCKIHDLKLEYDEIDTACQICPCTVMRLEE